jgi:formylglycine-generating enzyme required for sulfatase activity
MGDPEYPVPADGAGPVRRVRGDAFRIGATAFTSDQFASFVAAAGHVTAAERFRWSLVFAGLLPADVPPARALPGAP